MKYSFGLSVVNVLTFGCARITFVLNIYKTKSIVFGTKHSLNPKPQLLLIMNHVEIEQVENCHRQNILIQQ
jgi:hypothetical protein